MTKKMNDIVENISDTLPVMMYLHGFMSGANGAKQRQLQRQFKGRYRVIAPAVSYTHLFTFDVSSTDKSSDLRLRHSPNINFMVVTTKTSSGERSTATRSQHP